MSNYSKYYSLTLVENDGMDKDFFWNQALKFIDEFYSDDLEYPLQDYIYIQNNQLHFKEGVFLHPDIKRLIEVAFKAAYG